MNLFTQPLPSVVKCCRVMLDPRLICLMKTSYSQCKKREREREYEGEGESTNRIGRTACSCVCLLCVWFASCVSKLPSRFANWLDRPQNCPVFPCRGLMLRLLQSSSVVATAVANMLRGKGGKESMLYYIREMIREPWHNHHHLRCSFFLSWTVAPPTASCANSVLFFFSSLSFSRACSLPLAPFPFPSRSCFCLVR